MQEECDSWVELPEILTYFDIDEEEAKMASACHKVGHGIEGQIYEYSALHYVYHALTVADEKSFMSKEQINHA